MDKDYNMDSKWLKALTRGEVQADKPRPKIVYKDWQVSNKQVRGITNGNK